jgi:hypothetical protein
MAIYFTHLWGKWTPWEKNLRAHGISVGLVTIKVPTRGVDIAYPPMYKQAEHLAEILYSGEKWPARVLNWGGGRSLLPHFLYPTLLERRLLLMNAHVQGLYFTSSTTEDPSLCLWDTADCDSKSVKLCHTLYGVQSICRTEKK